MSEKSDHLKQLAQRLAEMQKAKPDPNEPKPKAEVSDLAKNALARLKAQGPRLVEKRVQKEREAQKAGDYYQAEETRPKGSQDAMDHRSSKGKFSKKEKQAYAKEMHMQALLQPPKEPLAEWLTDPTLLPKKPPGRKSE